MSKCVEVFKVTICYRQAGDFVLPEDFNAKIDILRAVLRELELLAGV